jgi:hypothetical protein
LQDGASRISGDTDEDSSTGPGGGSGSLGSKSGENMTHVPEKFGNGNASLSATTGKNVKKKPKSNIAKSNSSFVSRIISHDNLAKRLQERSSEDLMIFANINRAFNWLDMDSAIKVLFPLMMVARFCLLSFGCLYTFFATARTLVQDPLHEGSPDMPRRKYGDTQHASNRRYHRLLNRRYYMVRSNLEQICPHQQKCNTPSLVGWDVRAGESSNGVPKLTLVPEPRRVR